MSGKNITLDQMKDFAARADKRLDDLEKNKTDKISPVSISIPVSAWIENTDTTTVAAGFAFCADVAVEGLAEADGTDTVLDPACLEAAKVCGLSNTSMTMAGTIRYYAAEKPASALTATVRVIQGKST